jgi:hypothetical protein
MQGTVLLGAIEANQVGVSTMAGTRQPDSMRNGTQLDRPGIPGMLKHQTRNVQQVRLA